MREALPKAKEFYIYASFEGFPRLTGEVLGMAVAKPELFQVPGSYINHQDIVLRHFVGNIGINR